MVVSYLSRGYLILFALMLVTFVLGSVHAFSVFIVPLENLLGVARSEISLFYSFALVAITVSVLFGYLIYARLSAWLLVLLVCLIAACGLIVAAKATGWWLLFLGYSILFGGANGVGYGFTLQLSARELPQNRGFAMGAVTAAYAVGSIAFAKIFAWQIESISISAAFMALAYGLLFCGVLSASILYFTRASYDIGSGKAKHENEHLNNQRLVLYWLAYMFSVFAGLMAIGHAAGIAVSIGASRDMAVWCAMLIGVGSAAGGFIAGWLVDRWSITGFLTGLPLLSAVMLLMLAVVGSPATGLFLLGVVGFCYGAIIAIYPVAIANEFGRLGPKAYGRVFTAWGFSGLIAPWSAGLIYDVYTDYRVALVVAGLLALMSALTVYLGGFNRRIG